MLRKLNRRSFLKKSLYVSASTIAGLGLEGKTLFAANSRKPNVSSGTMPVGNIGQVKISRLICGGNLVAGYSHSRDLGYVSPLMRHYFTENKIMETLEIAEENGINTVVLNITNFSVDSKVITVLNKYWQERGGTIQWLAQVNPRSDDIKTNLKMAIDGGAVGAFIQGGIGDRWVKHNRIDLIGDSVSFLKENGLIAGVGGHSLEVPRACEKAGIDNDFYFKTFHHGDYWSATPIEKRVKFNVDSGGPYDHDNMWCIKPEDTIEFMKKVKKPWIAYKVLAAGAIHPESGFKFAFENGVDFVVAGMFDFQVVEDAITATEILSQIKKTGRERPWRG